MTNNESENFQYHRHRPAILILTAFCQPIVIIFHEIAIYCADRGQNENCWTPPESLFGVCVQFLSAERQLIWDRFSAMLVANTIILNALTDTYNDSTELLFTLIACVFGILLCFAWFMMTQQGWEFTDKLRSDAVNCFRWEGCPNPLIPVAPQRWTNIRRATISIIVLFIITYVLILIAVFT